MKTLKKINVLDKGFIELNDILGTEQKISQIAGISHKSKKGPSIDKLFEWEHMSPFEFASVTFKVKAPLFVIRQWMRHRTGHYMEQSLRYNKAIPEFYMPEKLKDNKSMTFIDEESVKTYNRLLDIGVEKEQARMVLPTSLYSTFYFQIDLRNLLNFLKLRLDTEAQFEIREYAKAIVELLDDYYPHYVNYVKNNYL